MCFILVKKNGVGELGFVVLVLFHLTKINLIFLIFLLIVLLDLPTEKV